MKLSPAEAALQSGLRAWLDAHYDFPALLERTRSAQTRDPRLWQGLVDGGWIARALPRRDDLQQSAIDAAVIAEEFGRALVVEPFLRSAYLAASLIVEAVNGAEADPLLAKIGSGENRFAAALYEPDGRFWLDRITTRAVESGAGWRLTGRKAMVMDGKDADRILISATTEDGSTGLFLVTGDAAGMTRTLFRSIDDFAAADIALDGVEAVPVAIGAGVPDAIQAAVDRTIVVLGAEAVGAAQAAIDETAAYTARREQFGRAIASFQVVAHRLARMFIELEGLRGSVVEALSNAGASAEERALAAAGLKVMIGENGRFVVNQGIQLHGGVGTVDEYKVSHAFKRVFAIETLFGNGDFHLERYARAMA
ncbi:MAG: pimeloyl-CoA dehydrogenase small subunit [Sphingomonadales bacterium]|nr:MAG: pimeloyl-CoA dehydrogenase small subunit [Sphingomonadales bacterium]